jgi:signal transduction histidine kinase
MSNRHRKSELGQGRELLPILLLLLVAVIVPTVCVLWFMGQAMRNERLAVHQKLTEIYRDEIGKLQRQIQSDWNHRFAALASAAKKEKQYGGGQIFLNVLQTAESAVIYYNSEHVRYPRIDFYPAAFPEQKIAPWLEAEALEFEKNEPVPAAAAFSQIARETSDPTLAARAYLSQARCLAKANKRPEAIAILTQELAKPIYANTTDTTGRFIVPNALFFALQLEIESLNHSSLPDTQPNLSKLTTLEPLTRRLFDYNDPLMPSSQRRFLMDQVISMLTQKAPGKLPGFNQFPTRFAEGLAAIYLESGTPPSSESRLSPTRLPELFQIGVPQKTVVGLYRKKYIVANLELALKSFQLGGRLEVQPPGTLKNGKEPFLVLPADENRLPGWNLALFLEGTDSFATAMNRQEAVYLWTGFLVIGVIVVLAILMVRYLVRQVKLTRLKNNFVATVSHELKTPLASMRVLVDTLLEGNVRDEKQSREYLELISKENERLSRLIDNFLTFSRMERNKRSFTFEKVSPDQIVRTAMETLRDRFKAGGCELKVELAPDLPAITADRDALVTVLLNLLDNAFKYSENEKHITLRAFVKDGKICFSVEDRGIGLSRRDLERIFDRFYQVDQSLSRKTGGCGLGLSIVKFIVEAHGGSIQVEGQVGKGSRFTVIIPIAGR